MAEEYNHPSQGALVNALIKEGPLGDATPELIQAFQETDRVDFVMPEHSDLAHFDNALPLEHGQSISQPTVVAWMLKLLGVEPGQKVLDVGAGSGWTTALLGRLVAPIGKVIGVERIPELVNFGRANLGKTGLRNVHIVQAGNELGYPAEAPYDRILVSAGTDKFPSDLLDQLNNLGRIVIPINNQIVVCQRKENSLETVTYNIPVMFVPLVRPKNEDPAPKDN